MGPEPAIKAHPVPAVDENDEAFCLACRVKQVELLPLARAVRHVQTRPAHGSLARAVGLGLFQPLVGKVCGPRHMGHDLEIVVAEGHGGVILFSQEVPQCRTVFNPDPGVAPVSRVRFCVFFKR